MSNTIGYTTGVFDLFHVGHINILKKSKNMCDYLIVGCSNDQVVWEMKNKNQLYHLMKESEILKSIKYVDEVVEQTIELYKDKLLAVELFKFHKMFVGDDWKNSSKFKILENKLKEKKIDLIYFPYTKKTSSTKINKILEEYRLND